MSDFKTLWGRTSRSARIAMVVGGLLIVVLTLALARWALARNYEPLFTGLAEQDASTMVAELDRMKVPYQLEDSGRRISVPHELVHKTRLQLVGKNLPLHGAVGFEIFNNSDFGITDFAQKVNYQRALQGELTRTIMSIAEVQAARVHLVMPESSLFKRDQNRPKASVTLAMKPGRQLAREQVSGIVHLVAAAVPGIDLNDVTVIDQQGITLSSRREAERDNSGWQLETQRQIEEHLVRKAARMLDRTFGPGQGVVSVDAVLNFDQMKVTTEEVLPAKTAGAAPPAGASGVLVRERQTVREPATAKGDSGTAAVTNSDTEYQTGRRVEQIVGTPGSLRRLNVGVVVPRGVSAERLERVRQIVAMAVGLDKDRGDGIAVYSLDQMADPLAVGTAAAPAGAAPGLQLETTAQLAASTTAPGTDRVAPDVLRYLGVLLLAALLLGAWVLTHRRRATVANTPRPVHLSEAERARLLDNARLWLERPTPARASNGIQA
jgi:flagellar M-ring protein FliF